MSKVESYIEKMDWIKRAWPNQTLCEIKRAWSNQTSKRWIGLNRHGRIKPYVRYFENLDLYNVKNQGNGLGEWLQKWREVKLRKLFGG